ncbi:hypothetical protein [Streptomyces sp. NPDC086777]|uniref:hypothetical protein n=1 Tax=Streptomyces sp. NPDC086777 TaxID=3154866 RepID=UPI0034503E24
MAGGQGAGEPQLEKATSGRALGTDEGVLEDAAGSDVIASPGSLVGEVAEEASAHVAVACGVGVVQSGGPSLAGVGMAAEVKAVPGNRLRSCV